MRILIDGDPPVYRAGFSSQNDWKILNWVDVVDEDDPEKDIERDAFFAYVWEMNEFIEEEGLHPDEIQKSIWVDPLPEAYCLKIVKDNLQNIVDAVKGYLAEEGQSEDVEVEVYLSGKTNFRNAVATIPGSFNKEGEPVQGYKANRKDLHRPFWYQRIRDYMVDVWGAVIFEGIEADDALAIEQWKDDIYSPQTIIATIDKDLQNVPGWHYNVLKQTDKLVTPAEAREHFYRQILTGDPTDNIPGCFKVGKMKAAKAIQKDMSEEEMFTACCDIYATNMEKYPERHGPFGERYEVELGIAKPMGNARGIVRECVTENARLLWMLQDRDQLWTPPGEPDESILAHGLLDVEDEFA